MSLKLIDPGSLDRLVRRLTVLLVVIGVLAGLVVLLLPILAMPRGQRSPTCMSLMRQHYQGLRLYLNGYDEFFPLAWHVGGAKLAGDLSNLTYYRSLISNLERAEFEPFVSPQDVARCGGDRREACRQKFAEVQKHWTDPGKLGWTQDYFSPEIVFRIPDPRETSFDKHSQYMRLIQDVSSSDRPLLAEVNASLPDPEARDPNDPEHEAEMRKGFGIVQALGIDVFVGVGRSLRRAGDYSTSRFDFRHNKHMYVLFLDGHVDSIKADDKARLEEIHRYWNSINPTPSKEPNR